TAAPRNAYRTRDGRWVCQSASTQAMTERVLRAIDCPELINDARFRTNADRLRHSEALDAIIAAFIGAQTLDENLAHFEREEVTVGPIYDIAQIMEDPYVIGREVLADYPDADLGRIPMHCVVPRLSATPGAIRLPAPALGEHNDAVLAAAGFDAQAIAALRACGALVDSS
ncbi:MAG: CoA transferase, partial [Proteobacteria bacterium]|nr:CoA transferase [Burkholderiales bacterium]